MLNPIEFCGNKPNKLQATMSNLCRFFTKTSKLCGENVDLTRFFTTRCKTLPTILLNLKKFCTKKPKTCKTTILNLTRYFRKNPDVLQKNVESDSD